MSECYRCRRDDIYGSKRKGTWVRSTRLVWVCSDCERSHQPVLYEARHTPMPAYMMPAVTGWLGIIALIITAIVVWG